jgi:Protein of unknown function (DUF1311).
MEWGKGMRTMSMARLAVAASLFFLCTAWADNPPEFESNLPRLIFAEIGPGDAGGMELVLPRRYQGDSHRPWRGAVEEACVARGSFRMYGATSPVTCGTVISEGDDTARYRVTAGRGIGVWQVGLFSMAPISTLPATESDEPRPRPVDEALPASYRGIRHSAVFTFADRTIFAVSQPVLHYAEPPTWTPAVLVAWKDGKATLLGHADSMPWRIIENADTAGPLAWVPVGCGMSDGMRLMRLQPGLAVVASYHSGAECEGMEGPADAVSGAIRCDKAGAGIDMVICSRDVLVGADREVAQHYANLRDGHEGAARDAIVASQKAWIRQRNACADPAIAKAYADGEAGCLLAVMNERVGWKP